MNERDLPVAGDGGADGNGGDGPGGPPPEPDQPPARRLVGTLGTAAVLAGLAIVFVYQWAHPRIVAHQIEKRREAIQEVLGAPERHEAMYVHGGTVVDSLPAGVDSTAAERVYAGYGPDGRLVGYAVPGQKPGYQDVVRLMFGYDPREDAVVGMMVLESKETPGLGAKITSDTSFINEFEGIRPPLEGVKEDGDGPHEIDMITGATISSETVIEIINSRLEALGPALRESVPGSAPGQPPGGAPGGAREGEGAAATDGGGPPRSGGATGAGSRARAEGGPPAGGGPQSGGET